MGSLPKMGRPARLFQDDCADTVDCVVNSMGRVQLGRALDDASVSLLTAFLESPAAEVPADCAPPR